MSLFGKKDTPAGAPAADPAAPAADPNAAPVSRAEFNRLDEALSRMAGAIENLAQRPVVVQAPNAPEAPPPDVSDEEIDAAVAEGKGAGTIKKLIDRRVAAATQQANAEIGAVRSYGTTMLGSLAERTFFNGLDSDDKANFQRFEKEVRELVGMCQPELRGHPQTWETAFSTVLGQHRRELESERVESELRRRADEAAAAAAPQPGTRGGAPRGAAPDDDAVPTITELAGEFPHLGEMTEADFIKQINRGKRADQRYKDWNDYVARGRAIDAQLAAIRAGETDNGVEPIPSRLQ